MYLKVKSAHFKIKAIVAVSVTQTHTHLYSLKAQGVQGYLSTCHFLHFARLCTTNISHVFFDQRFGFELTTDRDRQREPNRRC